MFKKMYTAFGDFNERDGKKRAQQECCLVNFGDITREGNRNGEVLINLCLEHGLAISANILPAQAKSHKHAI